MAYNFSQDFSSFLRQRSPYGEEEEIKPVAPLVPLAPTPLAAPAPVAPLKSTLAPSTPVPLAPMPAPTSAPAPAKQEESTPTPTPTAFQPAAPKTTVASSTPAIAESGPKPTFSPTTATQVPTTPAATPSLADLQFRNTAPAAPPPAAPLAPPSPKPTVAPTAAAQVPTENRGPDLRNAAPVAPKAPVVAPRPAPKPAIIPRAADQIPDFGAPAPTDRISGTEREFQMPTGQSVTDFVNFDRVLAANLSGMKKQLGKVAGRVEGKAGGARTALNDALSRFDALVEKNRKKYQARKPGTTAPSAPVAAITTPKSEDQSTVASPYGPAPGSATATAGDGTTTTSSALTAEDPNIDEDTPLEKVDDDTFVAPGSGVVDARKPTLGGSLGHGGAPTLGGSLGHGGEPTIDETLGHGGDPTIDETLGHGGEPTLGGKPVSPGTGGTRPDPNAWSDADLERMAKEGYEGPNSLADDKDFVELAKQIAAAQKNLNASKSEAGLGALFQEMVGEEGGSRGYSRGQSKFDAALTGAAEGGEHRLKGLQQKYGNMEKLLGDSVRTTKTIAEQAKREAKDTATAYQRDLDARKPPPSAPAPAAASSGGKNTSKNQSWEDFSGYTNDAAGVGAAAKRGVREVVEVADWANPNKWFAGSSRTEGSRGADAVLGDNPFNPDEKDVYDSMSQDELNALMALPHEQRRAEIERIKKQIRGG